ncbi:hypothetical protein K2X85_09020 [bacterium]|nr:hypothetical protein [bacterium]
MCRCAWTRSNLLLATSFLWLVASVPLHAQKASVPADPKKPTGPKAESSLDAAPPAKRNDFIMAPGAPRPPIKGFRETQTQSVPEPTGKKLDDLLRGDSKDDAAIDAFAKAQVSRLTLKGNEADRQILVMINRTSDSRARYDEESVRKYKTAVEKYLNDLLGNSVVVQVNALHVASSIQNGFGDVPDGVPMFLKVLKDPAREDAVKLMALVGLIRAKEQNLIKAAEEGEASAVILKELQKEDLQSVLEAKLYETLGSLGRSYAQLPGDVQVASRLAAGAIDPDNSLDARVEAARALAKMTLGDLSEWNSKLQAEVIAGALRDWVQASDDRQSKGIDARKYEAYLWLKAITKSLDQPPNQASAEFKDFAQKVAIEGTLYPLMREESVTPDEIDRWLEKNSVGENRKLAPRGPTIPARSEPKATTAAAQP